MEQHRSPQDHRVIEVLILICAVVSFLSGLTIYFLEPAVRESLINIDLAVSVVLTAVFIFRRKIRFSIKSAILIYAGMYIIIHSLVDGGSTRAVIPIMAAYIAVSFLYLSRRHSAVIAALSILILLFYGVAVEAGWTAPDSDLLNSSRHFSYWLYQALMMVINIALVGGAILSMKRIQEKYIGQLKTTAYVDNLTGIMNYEGQKEYIQSRLDKNLCDRGRFILFDIKNFRLINSLYGIEYGDKVLKLIGDTLKEMESPDFNPARLSNDEFSIWIENSDLEEIEQEKESFLNTIDRKLSLLDRTNSLLFYKSLALYPDHGQDFETLFAHASLALKDAENRQDFRIVHYDPGQERQTAYENRLVKEITRSLSEGEFAMHYQIKYDLKKEKPVGAEALARWETERIRSVSPAEFLPVIQKSDMMNGFTEYVLEKTFGDLPVLLDILGEETTVSINIPPGFFFSSGFQDTVRSLLKKHEADAGRIIFEITEDVFIEDMETINTIIDGIKPLGIHIALDDFGKGYSSLSYLRSIKIDELKIDKSFIDDIALDERSFSLFRSICDIADVYGFKVVAEGVEKAEQAERIKGTGCSIVQGYYFGRPVPLKELSSSIRKT